MAAPSSSRQVVNSVMGNNSWYTTGVDSLITSTASGAMLARIGYYYDTPPAIYAELSSPPFFGQWFVNGLLVKSHPKFLWRHL
jgi:hypothetical protein